jgi:hypothetical protein
MHYTSESVNCSIHVEPEKSPASYLTLQLDKDKQGFWNWLFGRPGHMPHSCGQVPPLVGCPLGIYAKWFAAAVQSKICWWWAASIFGGQVKFEILVAQGQPHHFWISVNLTRRFFYSLAMLCYCGVRIDKPLNRVWYWYSPLANNDQRLYSINVEQ